MAETSERADKTYDFIVVGSGAASVVAALIVKMAGGRPLILEKSDLVGGSTAVSGGVLWVPCSGPMRRAGVTDSLEAASAYLDACAGPPDRASSAERRRAFLHNAPKAI